MSPASLKRTDVRKISTAEIFLRMRYKNAGLFSFARVPVSKALNISLFAVTPIH
jgi:hypothetical protein